MQRAVTPGAAQIIDAPFADPGRIRLRLGDLDPPGHGAHAAAGAAALSATVAREADGEVALQARLDGPEGGRLIGTAAIACSGGRYRWYTVTCALEPVTGIHDVHVRLCGTGRLLQLRFERAAAPGGPAAPGEPAAGRRGAARRAGAARDQLS